MTATYEFIAGATLTSGAVYLEATNIPSTYTDLIVVLQLKESGSDGLNMQVGNGSYDTGSNYSHTWLRADYSGRGSNTTSAEIGWETTSWGNLILHINNYANTSTYKTFLARTNTQWLMGANVGLWRSTSAIERIRFSNGSSANHSAGSTINIYGIKAE